MDMRDLRLLPLTYKLSRTRCCPSKILPGFWVEGKEVGKAKQRGKQSKEVHKAKEEEEEKEELRKVSKAAIGGGSFKDRTQLEM